MADFLDRPLWRTNIDEKAAGGVLTKKQAPSSATFSAAYDQAVTMSYAPSTGLFGNPPQADNSLFTKKRGVGTILNED